MEDVIDIRKVIIDICYQDGVTRRQILAAYNKKYNKTVMEPAFNKMINNNNIKFNVLIDVLDSIGYKIDIKKKI